MNLAGILIGSAICLGSIGSYIPQFYNIIKYESVEGISEMSLVIMNIGLMCLTMNSIIFSWEYFFCKNAECFTNLFPFVQISLSWLMVLIYYFIFIIYKFRKRDKYEKRILSGLYYVITYILFGIFVVALALGEKLGGHDKNFFRIFGNILGYTSAVASGLVYLPQIYVLYKNKSIGSLSFTMYFMQTPGNLIIIFFQAFLYHSPLSTWITYLVVFIEQSIILSQMIYYYCRNKDREMRNFENVIENQIYSVFENYQDIQDISY